MTWYSDKGKDNDVAVSSRVRFARNLADYPFASRLNEQTANEIINKVSAVFPDMKRIDFTVLDSAKAASYVESHLVSPEFAASKLPHALLTDDGKSLAIMLCEEDHIRLQSIVAGNNLEAAYKNACEADDALCDKLNLAYDEELGFLTHCPTNLGTGMRASVMLFLPALTMTAQIDRLSNAIAKLGLTIRGMYGEGSDADDCLYQISNQITLGISEDDTVKKLNEVVSQLITRERRVRDSLKSDNSDKLRDKILRSYGVMKYAHMLSSREFMALFADVRLGIALGYIDDITYEKLGELMIKVMPAALTVDAGRELSDNERDIKRAETVRTELRAS